MTGMALVTGASAGIGEELARIHAAKGGDLILVARRRERLEELADELREAHGIEVIVYDADLSVAGAVPALVTTIEEDGHEVDVLINNAGFGGHGKFHEGELEREQRMIQLNITALTELTHYFVQPMVERGAGKVLNVGSTAGFLPGPLQSVYYASKAYVNSFSQAIANELAGTGVTVTVLCPGPVATEFQDAADLGGVRGFELANDAATVAKVGYRAMEKGQLLAFDDVKLRIAMDGFLPFMPRRLKLAMSRLTMEKSR